ncbi:NepR family anti-sigma factor [Mariluticola halotolerans]|uniref:NepR family anti-sigma factor n=1 Tax=Mariluticola halotolerans TaxID=2909283 RepID=UPI0026E2A6B9|nr:NepR family anti-sigma factor [Mariluticola halotolerans]
MSTMRDMTNSNRRRASDASDPNSQISQKLRELYSSVQEEAIPDRFLDLLEQLDEAEKAAGSGVNHDKK